MNIQDAFRSQSRACGALGSPFMERLMWLCAERLRPGSRVANKVLNWPGDYRTQADSVPLRLAGALHALRLERLALTSVYPPTHASDDMLWSAIEDAFEAHEDRLLNWLTFAPQTNEVRRAAVLLPVLTQIAKLTQRPLSLIELGASAGLNLFADRMALHLRDITLGQPDSPVQRTTEWTGPPPKATPLVISSRTGIDLNPIDATTNEGSLRLLTYIWPDQSERIARTKDAISLMQAMPPKLIAGDAGDMLEQALNTIAPDDTIVVFHTVAWQYFLEATKNRLRKILQDTKLHPAPLYWFGMETDGTGPGAALTITLPSAPDRLYKLGRADFHGRWVEWEDAEGAFPT